MNASSDNMQQWAGEMKAYASMAALAVLIGDQRLLGTMLVHVIGNAQALQKLIEGDKQ